DGGGHAAVAMQPPAYTLRIDQAREAIPRLVLADHGEQLDARPQGGCVARHVGCAARALLAPLDQHHGHRRFGRYAANLPEPVPVEHDVAYDEQPRRTGTCEAARRDVPRWRG